jgi:queuine/archaeosine tRNA-ribosyltransferase
MLGAILLSAINLAYYQELMAGLGAAIERGQFAEFRDATRELGAWRFAGPMTLCRRRATLRAGADC